MMLGELTPQRLSGKNAIVTGASRGIGLAIAQRLVSEGAKVVMTARGKEALTQAAAAFPEGSVVAIAGKVDDPQHRADVFAAVAREFGSLDILVNNAGINPVYGPLVDLKLDSARKILEVNLLGSLAWVQDAFHHPELQFADRSSSVINISSVAGQMPAEGIGWYGVSKAAVAHLTRTLSVELGPHIRVNAVAPAVVKTQFAKALYDGREDVVNAAFPLRRMGNPKDIASAVAFLASSDASWITGQVLTLDGGLLNTGGTV